MINTEAKEEDPEKEEPEAAMVVSVMVFLFGKSQAPKELEREKGVLFSFCK